MLSIYGWIPHIISNSMVVSCYSFLARAGKATRRLRRKKSEQQLHLHMEENTRQLANHLSGISADGGFLQQQSSYSDLMIGKARISAAGCGVIALYNLLTAIGENVSFPSLIAAMEKDGMVLGGKWGIAPGRLATFLQNSGFEVATATKPDNMIKMLSEYQYFLMTVYNDENDIRQQLHTVCIIRSISKNATDGSNSSDYTILNPAGMMKNEGRINNYESVLAHISNKHPKPLYLIAVNSKSNA